MGAKLRAVVEEQGEELLVALDQRAASTTGDTVAGAYSLLTDSLSHMMLRNARGDYEAESGNSFGADLKDLVSTAMITGAILARAERLR